MADTLRTTFQKFLPAVPTVGRCHHESISVRAKAMQDHVTNQSPRTFSCDIKGRSNSLMVMDKMLRLKKENHYKKMK